MSIRELEVLTLIAAAVALWEQIASWLAWPVRLLVVLARRFGDG